MIPGSEQVKRRNNDRGPGYMASRQGRWPTRMGKWFPGQRVVFRGRDLHRDLHRLSWVELYLYGITGRRFAEDEVRLLNAVWTYTSYPDPRLWNNRVAALGGTARTTGNLAVSAALAASEARIFGRGPDVRVSDFFHRADQRLARGEALADIIAGELRARRSIAGYGRPVTRFDERIHHMMELLAELGCDRRRFVRLAFDVEAELVSRKPHLRMNYGALAAAVGADLGLSTREYYAFVYPAFLAGMWPCYQEALAAPEGSFFPSRCDSIAYRGPEKRDWPGVTGRADASSADHRDVAGKGSHTS